MPGDALLMSGCFNSRLREEATAAWGRCRPACARFNSRLREEATAAAIQDDNSLPVSTHASVRRRRCG